MVVPSAEIIFLDELSTRRDLSPQASVRVLGRLREYSPTSQRALVALHQCELEVDTSLLQGVALQEGCLLQVIGELSGAPPHCVLHARVARNVDGLDVELYRQAVQLRRQFLARVAAPPS